MPSSHYIVQQGDCLVSISFREGFFWETLWNHPENADLKKQRKAHNMLMPGDHVFIPDLRQKAEAGEVKNRHRFQRKGVPARFTLTLCELGKPRANENYVLEVDGIRREGKTDSNGKLSEPIPPGAKTGQLFLGESREEILVNFGQVDPIEEVSGVQERLRNLGYFVGQVTGELCPETLSAIAEFQHALGISGQGELTDETLQALIDSSGG